MCLEASLFLIWNNLQPSLFGLCGVAIHVSVSLNAFCASTNKGRCSQPMHVGPRRHTGCIIYLSLWVEAVESGVAS